MSAPVKEASRADSSSAPADALALSSTVEDVLTAASRQDVSAGELVNDVLARHPEYLKALGRPFRANTSGKRLPAKSWLAEVQSLFDPRGIAVRAKRATSAASPPLLHGRLLIAGLALLDAGLRFQLDDVGAFIRLRDDIDEPFEEILTARGRELLRSPTDAGESLPNQPDDPMWRVEQDQLGRAAFARYLAERIVAVPEESGAYSIHLCGPWGSGKSTLLHFVGQILRDEKGWMVAEFNAWQHQHIRPPWWNLMEVVFRAARKRMRPWSQAREWTWRISTGSLIPAISLLIAGAWTVVFLVMPLLHPTSASPNAALLGALADNLGKVLAMVGTVWGLVIAYNRSLVFGSAKAAENYVASARDPMTEISARFSQLVGRVPARIAVFIDDLDRCQADYVIDLLEGIQTLFRRAPVVFVVAADRKWLEACYELRYEGLKSVVGQPGKPLGELFLEKVFQFTTGLPGLPPEIRSQFWMSLIGIGTDRQREELARARAQAVADLTGRSEGSVLAAVAASAGLGVAEQQAIREAAVARLATPEVMARTEHSLRPFADLLEQNPRAMKRLVNAFSANRAIALLSRVAVEREQLARWTILSLRWPRLADFLEAHPAMVAAVRTKAVPATGVGDDVKSLLEDNDVRRVLGEAGATGRLDEAAVSQCARLRGF
jgi:hypothetical protein